MPLAADPTEARAPIEAAWSRHFESPAPSIAVSAAGRASMPFAQASSCEQIAAEAALEGLDTDERREKVTVAVGPILPGATAPAWTHFLGADPPGSDTWGEPAFVAALVDLAAGWFATCAATAVDPATCTLQLGDLAWPEPADPDPLGHRDHDGACVDVRLFRSDGSRYEAWWNRPDDRPGRASAYDVATTAAFLRFAVDHFPITDLFFNDPAVLSEVPRARWSPGHDDHVHLCMDVGRLSR